MLFFENGKAAEQSVAAVSKRKFGPRPARHYAAINPPCITLAFGRRSEEEGMVCGGTMDIFIDVIDRQA